ncbi:MAG TPA: hypothetical protein DDW52_06170 [Planctomycetaceae bacterium]|nr:hypothetical protein [Planctomycetaceae bacterium]
MLRPHKLDDVFSSPQPVPENGHVIIKAAFEAANDALKNAEQKNDKDMPGPSPAQAAREAFLAAIDAKPC